jgi:hypothetical protein
LHNKKDCKTDNENIGNNKQGAADACTSASRALENIPVTIHVGNRRQSYFNTGKELPLTVRFYDRVTWEYGGGSKFSFILCQETGGIASTFYRTVVSEGVKIRFLISNVSAGNMLPASYRLGGPDLRCIGYFSYAMHFKASEY